LCLSAYERNAIENRRKEAKRKFMRPKDCLGNSRGSEDCPVDLVES
jgi:hypothetical protein